MFQERADHVSGSFNWPLRPEVRIQLLELLHLGVGSPANVAVPGFSQIHLRYLVETTRHVKPSRNLVGDAFNVYEAVFSCRADRSIVQAHSFEVAAFHTCNLRADESRPAFK